MLGIVAFSAKLWRWNEPDNLSKNISANCSTSLYSFSSSSFVELKQSPGSSLFPSTPSSSSLCLFVCLSHSNFHLFKRLFSARTSTSMDRCFIVAPLSPADTCVCCIETLTYGRKWNGLYVSLLTPMKHTKNGRKSERRRVGGGRGGGRPCRRRRASWRACSSSSLHTYFRRAECSD